MLKIITSPLFLGLLALLAGEALLFLRWRSFAPWERRACRLIGSATIALLLASLPIVSSGLALSLTSRHGGPSAEDLRQARAVVILGGNQVVRGLCGIQAFKRSQARWLVLPNDPEGRTYTRNLAVEVGVTADRILYPPYGRNTYAEARNLRDVSQVSRDDAVGIVSDAWHLPRAMGEFRRYFPRAFAIPCGGRGLGAIGVSSFLPQPRAVAETTTMLDEYLGMAWYRVRRWTGQ